MRKIIISFSIQTLENANTTELIRRVLRFLSSPQFNQQQKQRRKTKTETTDQKNKESRKKKVEDEIFPQRILCAFDFFVIALIAFSYSYRRK